MKKQCKKLVNFPGDLKDNSSQQKVFLKSLLKLSFTSYSVSKDSVNRGVKVECLFIDQGSGAQPLTLRTDVTCRVVLSIPWVRNFDEGVVAALIASPLLVNFQICGKPCRLDSVAPYTRLCQHAGLSQHTRSHQ